MGEPLREPLDPPIVPRSHEGTDAPIRPLAVFLLLLTGSLVLTVAAMIALFNLFESAAERRELPLAPLADEDAPTPGPLLQVSPREDMQQYRAREDRTLGSTEWINQPLGVVRIPLERAIELTAAQGFRAWPAADVMAAPAEAEGERAPQPAQAESPSGTGQSVPPPTGGLPP